MIGLSAWKRGADRMGRKGAEGGDDELDEDDSIADQLSDLAEVPLFLAAPLIDAFGRSSWDVPRRRTRLLFQLDARSHPGDEADAAFGAGGLARFSTEPGAAFEPEGRLHGRGIEIALVGHSMGTIVI